MNGVKKLKGGNDAKMDHLPSRFAMATVTKGDVHRRIMNDYGKKPPKGFATAPMSGYSH